MVPSRNEGRTPKVRAWTKVISDSDEMRKFITKVKSTFQSKRTRNSKREKREEDITVDAAILPTSTELRSPGNSPQDENSHVNSPTAGSQESQKLSNFSHHNSPAESLTSASSNPLKNTTQELHQQWTVADVVNECPQFADIPEDKQSEIITRINKTVQELPEYFYDFCMVSSDKDYEDAKMLKDELSAKFNLKGCTIYEDDFFSLGTDSFEAYERMMDRSTKIFFYISSSLNKDAFCRRLQSASVFQGLMSKIRREKEKCVPVFPKGICRVPLPLSGIGGLEIPNASLTAQRIRITYREDVRNQRISLEIDRKKSNFLKMVREEVHKYFHEDEDIKVHPEPLDSDDDSGCQKVKSEKHTPTPPNEPASLPSGLFESVQGLLRNATSSPVVASSEMTIDSTTAHIGHNITIHVNYQPVHTEEGSNRGSRSSSSDSEAEC
ncbi:uncharacterized protein LOC124166869 [Ischnura elegans]|uniref:uncharacterized protein LOC124166869 n=1 Tax=Ischnura elegans TaxID=197161 RepID=UPI001ED879BD|nr:uncharacterized protein LOC124166869 [Ischnura elegans]